jgi:pimeloyl-ACP methyl ester carboxylesterase
VTGDRRSETWRRRGSYFSWAGPDGASAPVQVFHLEAGPADAPVLLLVHGFPTCSIDWYGLVERLEGRFRICALDFPGYGFSDKPRGWGYSLAGDTALLDFYVREVVRADSVMVMGHDRGSSVALNYALENVGRVGHLVLTNGNIFLPLSNLTEFQRRVLDPARAPAVLGMITPALLAAGMGASTFSPPRAAEDPDVEALADTFAHDDGVGVLHETIQYLVERADHEREWLDALGGAEVTTTVVWGLEDTISPPRVATHVWSEFLMLKPGRNRLYLVPGANHYLQVDRPDALVTALGHSLEGADPVPGPIAAEVGSPVLVDWSRPALPTAAEVLAPTA